MEEGEEPATGADAVGADLDEFLRCIVKCLIEAFTLLLDHAVGGGSRDHFIENRKWKAGRVADIAVNAGKFRLQH